MILCVDIGNSRTKLGWFERNQLMRNEIVNNKEMVDVDQNHPWFVNVELIAISSVNKRVVPVFEASGVPVFMMKRDVSLPIEMRYDTPETLGFDRILAAAGASLLHPDQNVLVIDSGTCITYDLVIDRAYIGGAIAPGLQQRLTSMNTSTDQLPKLTFSNDYVTIGTSTESCMHMGAGFSSCREMEGMIDHFTGEYGDLKVLITGGDAAFFERHVKNATFAAPNLVLHGLHTIVQHNVNDIDE